MPVVYAGKVPARLLLCATRTNKSRPPVHVHANCQLGNIMGHQNGEICVHRFPYYGKENDHLSKFFLQSVKKHDVIEL